MPSRMRLAATARAASRSSTRTSAQSGFSTLAVTKGEMDGTREPSTELSSHYRSQSTISGRPSTLSQASIRDVGTYNVTKVRRQSVASSIASNKGSNV